MGRQHSTHTVNSLTPTSRYNTVFHTPYIPYIQNPKHTHRHKPRSSSLHGDSRNFPEFESEQVGELNRIGFEGSTHNNIVLQA